MKKLLHYSLFTLLLLLFSFSVKAQWQNGLWTQKQAYNWYFGGDIGIDGSGTGLNFSTIPPQVLLNGQMVADEGSGVISDKNGNLLFYSDGNRVWNKNHEIMENSEGLLGSNSATQTGLIIPAPSNPDVYYIFYLDATDNYSENPKGFLYAEVNMTLNNGLGAVTNKNILLSAIAGEKVTAVYHADKEQVWVICHKATVNNSSNEIMAFLVSDEGVSTTPVVSAVGDILSFSFGQMKASPDGSKLALINSVAFFAESTLQVFDFNNTTGEITNPVTLASAISYSGQAKTPLMGYGLEFSPNNRFLYIADRFFHTTDDGFFFGSTLRQLDLLAGDEAAILASDIILAQYNDEAFGALQVAPDGKIYLSNQDKTSLSIINHPNNKGGEGSGFELGTGAIGVTRNLSFGLPGFIQSYFESGILYEGGKCPGEVNTFSTLRIPGITSIVWDFGDTESGTANTSVDLEPTHAFTKGGTYTVTAIITSNGAEQIATTQVTILPAPDTAIPNTDVLTQCSKTGIAVFNLKELDLSILNGQGATEFTVAYFANEADVVANNPITVPESFSTAGQTVYAKVTNTITGCLSVISFPLTVNPTPLINKPNDLQQCSDSETVALNLTEQNTSILGNQDPNIFKVNYYASESDAIANNPITVPEDFMASNQIVYTVVTNTLTGCSSDIIEFEIEVIVTSLASDILELIGCSPFNLNTITPQIESGLILSFYTQEEDALNSKNAIADTERYMVNNELTVVYIRAEDPQGCAAIYRLQLQQKGCTIPRGISPNNDGKNDNFDLTFLNVKQLTIFNRYGQSVYNRKNYTTEWHGQSDNGNELPTGTYYYMVETREGENKTGWVYINREIK